VARWRKRAAPEIPAWLFDPAFAAEAETWLDDLEKRDPGAWEDLWVAFLSTPVYPKPYLG
jgi:hypothetical protein